MLTIYSAMSYLDATLEPTYHDVEPTEVYRRRKEVRDALYGPIVPTHLNEHLKRYTRASGEFELAFDREPGIGDVLRYKTVVLMHRPDIYSSHFGAFLQAWQRQLPHLTCPLKFEDGRLLRRQKPETQGMEAVWKEDVRIQPENRWLRIPEVFACTGVDPDSETVLTISGVVFPGWLTQSISAGRLQRRSYSVKISKLPLKNLHFSNMESKHFLTS